MSEERLDRIETILERLTKDVEHLSKDVEELKQETTRTNDRVETYQKASQQVVNLAFSLILAATAAIVIPAVFGK